MSKVGAADRSPIPVLHIITRLIVGGAQETVMLTADLFDDRPGWRVEVISGPQTGSEGSLIENVRQRGIPLTLEPSLVREINPVNDLIALFRLTRFIRRGGYHVVHTNSSKAGILGRWAAWLAGLARPRAAGPRPVIIHTVHGWSHHERQHPLARRFFILLEQLTAPITDKLIVVSPLNTEKGLRDNIARPEKYITIRSGIDLERFRQPERSPEAVRAELGIPQDAPVVGTVTRLSAQKAPLDFVAAAAEVAQQRPDAHFVVVGDGPLRAEVEAEIAAQGLSERVHLTGLRRDVPEILALLDVFVLPSLWEGLPIALLEAMAAGLPVVATRVGGVPEVVVDGESGLLVPPRDSEALAEAILTLLQDPELRQKMGQAGQERVREHFSVERMVQETEALYERLLVEKGLKH